MVISKPLSLEGCPAITLIFRYFQRARHLTKLNISLQNLWSFEDVEFYMCRKFPVSETVHAGPQVLLLLSIADWMVHSMWRSGKDPDSFSIPYLTALGDLLGTALLALSFHFLWLIGDQDSDVGD